MILIICQQLNWRVLLVSKLFLHNFRGKIYHENCSHILIFNGLLNGLRNLSDIFIPEYIFSFYSLKVCTLSKFQMDTLVCGFR